MTTLFVIPILKHKIGADCSKNYCMFLAAEMLDMLSQISKPFNHLAIKEETVICSGINLLTTVLRSTVSKGQQSCTMYYNYVPLGNK